MVPPQQSTSVATDNTENSRMTSESSQNDEETSMSLQEENALLRTLLADTEKKLRLLQTKENLPPRSNSKKWNYREWINRDHELVPQDDSTDVEMTDTDGLMHRRRLDSPPLTASCDVVENQQRPIALKAKRSDIESPGSPSSRSENSDESWLMNEDDECVVNIEDESFVKSIADRAGWLVGLLILQSCSSFILSSNQGLLQSHIVLVQFLTMLVGAGGNAGNQASVRGTK